MQLRMLRILKHKNTKSRKFIVNSDKLRKRLTSRVSLGYSSDAEVRKPMKYLPDVQVMSAKSSVRNTANITSCTQYVENTIKMSVHD